MTKISFDNIAKKIGEKEIRKGVTLDYYKWRVFVAEKDEVLNKIEYVEYLLHPTFPHPNRRINSRLKKFALDEDGYGSFMIGITVKFKDMTEEHYEYFLDISKPWIEFSLSQLELLDLLNKSKISEFNEFRKNNPKAEIDLSTPGPFLVGVDISKANLSSAKLSGTSLIGSNLSSANLSNANLSGVNLTGADLSNANLSGADLSDATFIAVNTKGVRVSEMTKAKKLKISINEMDRLNWNKMKGLLDSIDEKLQEIILRDNEDLNETMKQKH